MATKARNPDDSNQVSNGGWEPRDVRLGLFFVAVGGLLIAYGVESLRNGNYLFLWGSTFLLGPVLLAVGANATFQALRVAWRRRRIE